jgi:hypothetical protein
MCSFLLSTNSGNSAFEENEDSREDPKQLLNDDSLLHLHLQRAKSEILGAPIPSDVSKAIAEPAEKAFLAAMKEVSQEFKSLKEELGSDVAIDIFLQKLDDDNDRIIEEFSVFE